MCNIQLLLSSHRSDSSSSSASSSPSPPPSPRPPKNVAAKRADVIAKMKMLTDQKAQVARRFNSELIVKLGWLDQSIISTTLKLFKFDVSCLLLNDVRSSS